MQECADGENRKKFLHEEKSHVLYYWQSFDENELLRHSLAQLSDDTKVDSDHVPKTSLTTKKGGKNSNDQDFKMGVSKAFKELSKTKSCSELRLEKKSLGG